MPEWQRGPHGSSCPGGAPNEENAPRNGVCMRVLHVINSLILAGAEVLLAEMLLSMRQRGLEVAVVVLKHLDSPLEIDLQAAGFHFLPSRGSDIYSPFHIWSLAKHMSSFDVVH